MEYKEKYEMALETIREILDCGSDSIKMSRLRLRLQSVFPELRESEDERVRKALLELVHDTTGDELWVDYNVHKEDALAWLEKQGETFTKKDVDDAYLKGVCDTKHELEKQGEQKPAWSEEDEDRLNSCVDAINAVYKWDSMIAWLKSLKQRVGG